MASVASHANGEPSALPPLSRHRSSTTTSGRPMTAPGIMRARAGSSQGSDAQQMSRGIKLSKNPNQTPSVDGRARSNSRSTEKAPSHLGQEHYVPSPRPATADTNANGRRGLRGSILLAASDALGLKLGRRRQSIRQPPAPIILPDVIEISAPRADEEDEERSRLREMAAQAIGLQPYMVSPSHIRDDSATDEDEDDDLQQRQPPILDGAEIRRLAYVRSESTPNIASRSPHASSLSVSIPPPQSPPPPLPASASRLRSGSMAGHAHSNSTTFAPIPAYPSTVASLASFRQCAGTYPKYYPPSSLRIFALSKNWKYRYLVLSSPATLVTRGQGPAVSYLHLFKSASPDEREAERLEINEDSVVFVAEEEVGGKRAVVKVGGIDVGVMKKEYMIDEGGHSMWLLQISDPADAQKWITNIKNAILGQRTVRAGLIPAHTLGGNEPRGDMDVMLSIRAQGIIPSPTTKTFPPGSYPATSETYASSISSKSARSQAGGSKSTGSPTSAVSALKGLFTGSRPRSASRAASIESERQQDRDVGEESFASMGSNLLNMLRSSTPDSHSVHTIPASTHRTMLPFSGPVNVIERRLDRKIVADPQPPPWVPVEPLPSKDARANKALSLGALPLQPPPRKRWTAAGLSTMSSTAENATEEAARKRDTLSIRTSNDNPDTDPLASPAHSSAFHFGTPEQRPRAPSLQSVSTYASGDNVVERSSSSTKRSSAMSARRWSRQGSILPNRMTPPSEPPPAPPTNQPGDRAPSVNSSNNSQRSVVSALPSFSKRASGSESIHSVNSFNTTQSLHSFSITSGARNRTSMPPPRPAPTVALPPAPLLGNQEEGNQDVLKPLESLTNPSKSPYRNSTAAQRTSRLSMVAPKPPPNTTLPPRPDEPDFAGRLRRLSAGSGKTSIPAHSTRLESIPASPIPPSKVVNPFPPPVGPLPPPPPPPPSGPLPLPPPADQVPPKRTTSLKARLRMLSTGSASSGGPTLGRLSLARSSTERSSTDSSYVPTQMMTTTASPPATPIAEKIMHFQDDSFLQMYTPVIPSLPPPSAILGEIPPQDEESEIAEVTSLSPPPPRRGSKQIPETDLQQVQKNLLAPTAEDDSKHTPNNDTLAVIEEPKRFSLSGSGSPLSPRSQHSQLLQDASEVDSPLVGALASPEDLDSPELEEKLSSISSQRHLSRPGSVISLGIMSI